MKPRQNLTIGLIGLSLLTAPAWSGTISQLTADGQTFDAYFEEHDGQEWLLIGRGRNGWEFDSDGQGSVAEVAQDVGTTDAFAPKCYSDAIINDLLSQVNITDVGDVTFRLSRASDTTGTVEFQDVRWTNLSGNGGAFTWDLGASSPTFSLDVEFKNAPAGLPGAAIGVHPGRHSRDANIGNDARRIFTWAWGSHGNQRGFSYGQSVTAGTNSATNFLWENGSEGHSLPYTEVYIPYVSGPDETPPAIVMTNPVDDASGAPLSAPLTATFDEPIVLTGAGSITLTDLTNGGADTRVIALPDPSVTVANSVLTIDPVPPFANATEYEVIINGLAIEDGADTPNAFPGTSSAEWSFTSVGADLTAPTIASLLPADGEGAAGPADNLVITFDENVLLNAGASTVLLDENFDSGDGGFNLKIADAAGTPWSHGPVDSNSEFGGGVFNSDNSGSGQAWGTGLGDSGADPVDPGYYADPTNTCLRSPVIDLTAVSAASLTFAEAIDAPASDTLTVRIIEAATDTVIATVYTSVDGNQAALEWDAANDGEPISLAAGVGQSVRLEWCLIGTAEGLENYAGWYIDDVRVTGVSAANSITLKNLTSLADTVIPIDDSTQVSVSGAEITINPTDLLVAGADYAIQIGSSAIRNYNDVSFAGIADDTTWNFTTASDAVFVTAANTGVNSDTWTAGANWDIGAAPNGVLTATIQSGLTALANSSAVETYSGGLTIESGATLQVGSGGSTENRDESALALGTGPVTMESGSTIQWQMKVSPTVPALTLNGDASIVTTSNESHSRNFNFSEISGSGQLTFLGTNNQTHTFDTASPSWSGGFVSGVASSARTRFVAAAEGVFGTGNVTIGASTDLQINDNNSGAGNVIDDAATLTIDGPGRDQSPATKLVMNGDETVNLAFRDGIALQPGTYGSLGLGGVDNEVSWISGGGILTVTATAPDATAPSIASIVSPPAGGPIFGTPTIPYTVTFDEEIDPSSVDSTDFTSIGTAPFSISSVTQISGPAEAGVFRVEIATSGPGTVIFQVAGTIQDYAGNALVVPVDDLVTYTLDGSAEPPKDTITIDQVVTSNPTSNPHELTVDASGSDKLVIVVTGEHGFNNASGNCSGITYDGEPLIQAVDRAPVASVTDTLYNDIWYLDDPGSVHVAGAISASVTTRGVITVFTLSGTAPGVGTTAVGSPSSKFVDLLTTSSASLVIASHGMGGFNNNADTQNADAVSPLVEESAVKQGSNWNGHVTGSQLVASPSLVSATYTGGNVSGNHVIAAEFLAADLPVSGNPYDTWASSFGGLTDPDSTVDFDGGGLETGIEWVVGGDPSNSADDAGLVPTLDTTTDPDGKLLFIFRRTDAANADGNTSIAVEYGSDLSGWTTAVDAGPGPANITISEDDDFYGGGVDRVIVALPPGLAADGKLFTRLSVTIATP